MEKTIRRRFQYDDRFAVQQANQAIRKDVRRALIELITNCSDSYHRLEDKGQKCTGIIVVELLRKFKNSLIRIHDYAEGMDDVRLDHSVGKYAGQTSGFSQGHSVRGLWGRGLKDAIWGLGSGRILSICDDKFYSCDLYHNIRKEPTYERPEKPKAATKSIRKQFDILEGNGTIVEIQITHSGVVIPQFENLRHYLEKHFELRSILANENRQVLLREIDSRNKIKDEVILGYKFPIGDISLDNEFTVEPYNVKAHLCVYRAHDPLILPSEEKFTADGGIVVSSKNVALDLTLFRFEHSEYASRFYGTLTCDYFHELIRGESEEVLTATRDGINWSSAFASTLKKRVESLIAPLIEDEKKRAQTNQKVILSRKMRERLNNALRELNGIASKELGKTQGPIVDPPIKDIQIPSNGFGFIPEFAKIQSGKSAMLILRGIRSDKISSGNLVVISSNNLEIGVLTPKVYLEHLETHTEILEAKIYLEGRQVGAEAIVTAELNGVIAEAGVRVISKKEAITRPPSDKPRSGFLQGCDLDPNADPRQRVKYTRETNSIIIATRAPSVALYLGEDGTGQDSPSGQVLIAELIIEAACREMARRKVDDPEYPIPEGGQEAALQKLFIDYQNKYAHLIHRCMVDSVKSNELLGEVSRKGRPTREELSKNAVVPL